MSIDYFHVNFRLVIAHLLDTTVVYYCSIWCIWFNDKSLQDQLQRSQTNNKQELCFYDIIAYMVWHPFGVDWCLRNACQMLTAVKCWRAWYVRWATLFECKSIQTFLRPLYTNLGWPPNRVVKKSCLLTWARVSSHPRPDHATRNDRVADPGQRSSIHHHFTQTRVYLTRV